MNINIKKKALIISFIFIFSLFTIPMVSSYKIGNNHSFLKDKIAELKSSLQDICSSGNLHATSDLNYGDMFEEVIVSARIQNDDGSWGPKIDDSLDVEVGDVVKIELFIKLHTKSTIMIAGISGSVFNNDAQEYFEGLEINEDSIEPANPDMIRLIEVMYSDIPGNQWVIWGWVFLLPLETFSMKFEATVSQGFPPSDLIGIAMGYRVDSLDFDDPGWATQHMAVDFLNISTDYSGPFVHLSPTQAYYWEKTVGSESSPIEFTLINYGGAVAEGNVYIFGSASNDFTISQGSGSFYLQPDEEKTIMVKFTPKSVGEKNAFLKADGNYPCNDAQSSLLGIGKPPPVLSFNPTSFECSLFPDNETSGTFNVTNAGGSTLNYQVNEDCSWIDIGRDEGSIWGDFSRTVYLTVNTTGMSSGSYSYPLSIESNGGNDNFWVYLDVISPDDPFLSYSPHSHNFGSMLEGTEKSFTFNVWNAGSDTLDFTLDEDLDWASISVTSGSSSGEDIPITVTVNTTGLALGSYNSQITIDSDYGSGAFTFNLEIVDTTEPILAFYPDSLDFNSKPAGELFSETFTIENLGIDPLDFTLTEYCNWIVSIDPISGVLESGESQTVALVVDTTGLNVGDYSDKIHIHSDVVDDENLTVMLEIVNTNFDPSAPLDITVEAVISSETKGGVRATVKNAGNEKISNIDFSLYVRIYSIKGKESIDRNISIDSLEPGEEKKLVIQNIHGASIILAQADANALDYEKASEFKFGIVLFSLVLFNRRSLR